MVLSQIYGKGQTPLFHSVWDSQVRLDCGGMRGRGSVTTMKTREGEEEKCTRHGIGSPAGGSGLSGDLRPRCRAAVGVRLPCRPH